MVDCTIPGASETADMCHLPRQVARTRSRAAMGRDLYEVNASSTARAAQKNRGIGAICDFPRNSETVKSHLRPATAAFRDVTHAAGQVTALPPPNVERVALRPRARRQRFFLPCVSSSMIVATPCASVTPSPTRLTKNV